MGFLGETVQSTVKDLGVCQRKYARDTVLPDRGAKVEKIAQQIQSAGMAREVKVTQAKSLLCSAGLYGVELWGATRAYLGKAGKARAVAIWGSKGPRNRGATLLAMGLDPWVTMNVLTMTHWARMARMRFFEIEDRGDYWEDCKSLLGKVRGPVHHMVKLSQRLGLQIRRGQMMFLRGGWHTAENLWDIKEATKERAEDLQWSRLANARYHFGGLQTGRDQRGG